MKYFLCAIAGLIIGILLTSLFRINPEVTTQTVYIRDTMPREIIKPDIVTLVEKIQVPVPNDVDTAAILADYFARNIYERKWENEEVRIWVTDTLQWNKLIPGSLMYSILRPTAINTTTVRYNEKYLTLEGILPVQDPFNPGVRFSYSSRYIYSITFKPVTQGVEVGFGFKILRW